MSQTQFVYRPRTPEEVRARAQASGSDFDSFLLDDFMVFKPQNGDNWIRILPATWPDPRHYGLDIHVHYSVGPNRGSCLCLARMANQNCPICEAVVEEQRAGNDEEAKQMSARKRILVWLLDRKKPDGGPLLWAVPANLDADFNKVCEDPTTRSVMHIDDPYAGHDVIFDRSGQGVQVRYAAPRLAPRPTSVPQEILDYIQAYPVPATLRWRSYEEVNAMFGAGAGPQPGVAPVPSAGWRPPTGAAGGRSRRSTTAAPPPLTQQPQYTPPPTTGYPPPPPPPQTYAQPPQPQYQPQQPWEGHPGDPGDGGQPQTYAQPPQTYAQPTQPQYQAPPPAQAPQYAPPPNPAYPPQPPTHAAPPPPPSGPPGNRPPGQVAHDLRARYGRQ